MDIIKTVKKTGSDLLIDIDISRIVAISAISEKTNSYYIYFENACWNVQPDSYDEVYNAWKELINKWKNWMN